MGTYEEWKGFKEVLDLFCLETDLKINNENSSFLYSEVNEEIRDRILTILNYKMEPVIVGFKYLGYYLKHLGYFSND